MAMVYLTTRSAAHIAAKFCAGAREVAINHGSNCESVVEREGSLLNAMLADAAVVSVAFQSGVPAAALALSVGRLPAGPVTPVDLENFQPGRVPASPIGAALDLVVFFEWERAE